MDFLSHDLNKCSLPSKVDVLGKRRRENRKKNDQAKQELRWNKKHIAAAEQQLSAMRKENNKDKHGNNSTIRQRRCLNVNTFCSSATTI